MRKKDCGVMDHPCLVHVGMCDDGLLKTKEYKVLSPKMLCCSSNCCDLISLYSLHNCPFCLIIG